MKPRRRVNWPVLFAMAGNAALWGLIAAVLSMCITSRAQAAELTASAGGAAPCQCGPRDSWTGQDKKLHLIGGAAIAAGVAVHTGDPWRGFYAGAAAGVLKEALDATGAGHVSHRDLIVTVIGAAIGASGSRLVIGHRFVGVRSEF